MRSILPCVAVVSAALLWIIGSTPPPARADLRGDGSGARVAVVLFLSYQVPGAPTFDVGALHAECWDQVTAAVHGLGRSEVPRAEIEPLVHRWGVRTALLVSEAFLSDVASGCGADELLVCDLMIYQDRLVLCARSVRTDTGRVAWADLEDARLPVAIEEERTAAVQRWPDQVGPVTRRLLGRWSAAPAREDLPSELFLLPVRTGGLETAVGRLVTCCILRSLLESPSRSIEDPGVTFSRLREAGVDPQRLDGRLRLVLGDPGTPGTLLVSDLVLYGFPDDSQQIPHLEEETAKSSVTPLPDSALSMRLVDADSGIVIFSATEYLEVPSTRGLFGIMRDIPLIQRVQHATDRLVHASLQKG